MKFFNLRPSVKFVSGIFLILLFFGALFWAKAQDPFVRKWFTIHVNGHAFKCVAVLPKPVRPCPVVIYAHGSGGSLLNDGQDLRQMAELGLAVVSLEYNQTNETAFAAQFEALLNDLSRQKWANTNAIAWIGFSLGANRMWDFALQHTNQQPQLLIQLSCRGFSENETNLSLSTLNPHLSTLLIHGEQDEIFPVADTRRLTSILQSNGHLVELKILPGLSHGLEPERGVVFRGIGEYCLTHLTGKDTWQHYHSIAQWQAEAPRFWLFCLPAIIWLVGWLIWWQYRKPVSSEKVKLTRWEIVLRCLAVILAIWALVETGIHILSPQFSINYKTLAIARKVLVPPKERDDFEYLAAQPIWPGQKLKTLLTHVELANYNRQLINWQLDEKMYQEYVLSPVINQSTDFNWRRPLWEEFYPRIRHESSPEDAAKIVIRHLRERVTIADIPNPPREVSTIWLRQITDETGFQIITVAALRSVGVPARLNSNQQTEFWNGNQWQAAPVPVITSW